MGRLAAHERAAAQARREQEREESILRAVAEIVSEVEPQHLTVARVIERTGISRATFYVIFDNGRDALERAFELAQRRLQEEIEAGLDQSGPWGERIAAAISALVALVAAEPAYAALCLLHSHAICEDRSSFQPVLMEPLMRALRDGRKEIGDVGQPRRTEEFVACGILSVIAERLRAGEIDSQEGLATELTELALCCYPQPGTGRNLES